MWPRDLFVATIGADIVFAVERASEGSAWSVAYVALTVAMAWAVYVPKAQR